MTVVKLIISDFWSFCKFAQRIKKNGTIFRNNTASENNGRNMPLPCSPEAHYEPEVARFNTALIRVRYNRRIKKGSRFNRILHREKGSYQKFFCFTYLRVAWEIFRNFIEIICENGIDFFVPVREIQINRK